MRMDLLKLYHINSIMPINKDSFNVAALIILIVIFLFSIAYIEKYFFYRLSSYLALIKNVFLICLISFLLIISIDFLLKASLFYRSTIIFFICFSFLFLLIKRILVKLFLEKIRIEGMDYKNIMIIGYGHRGKELNEFLNRHKEYGMKVSCIIDSNFNTI